MRLRRFVTQDERGIWTVALFALSMLLAALHWWQLPVEQFTHDLPTHQKYMRYIAGTFTVPRPTEYWGFYHPPLYYIFGALILKIGTLLTGAEQWKAVSALSLACYGVYLCFASRLLLLGLRDTKAYLCAFALVALWPLGIHMARAINNDVPLFMAQAATLYYLLRWWDTGKSTTFIKALLWNALSIAIKSNGLVLTLAIACVALLRWYITKEKPTLGTSRFSRLGLCAALAIALLPLGRSFYYYEIKRVAPAPVFVAAGLSQAPEHNVPAVGNPYLDNAPWHFLAFDFGNYFTQPFYNVRRDEGGRQYFWNAVLKTALFDEYHWQDAGGARVLNATLLLLLSYTIITGLYAARQPARHAAPLLICIACQLGALLALRLMFPADWHQNYRFIFASTPLLCLAFGLAAQSHRVRGRYTAATLGISLASLFCLQAFMFILRQHIS